MCVCIYICDNDILWYTLCKGLITLSCHPPLRWGLDLYCMTRDNDFILKLMCQLAFPFPFSIKSIALEKI